MAPTNCTKSYMRTYQEDCKTKSEENIFYSIPYKGHHYNIKLGYEVSYEVKNGDVTVNDYEIIHIDCYVNNIPIRFNNIDEHIINYVLGYYYRNR